MLTKRITEGLPIKKLMLAAHVQRQDLRCYGIRILSTAFQNIRFGQADVCLKFFQALGLVFAVISSTYTLKSGFDQVCQMSNFIWLGLMTLSLTLLTSRALYLQIRRGSVLVFASLLAANGLTICSFVYGVGYVSSKLMRGLL